MTSPELVDAYWRQYQLSQSALRADRMAAESLFHVWEEVEEVVQSGRPDVVRLLVALADAAPGDQALATLGAGPLEDLIRLHAEDFVDQIDEAARRNEAFRKALRCVWYDESVEGSTRMRLQRFGPPF